MNIRDTMKQQLNDLSAHLRETAALDMSQLGSEWEARKKALLRDAIFLDTFVIPDVADQPDPAVRIAEFMPPPRVDLEVKPEESGTGVPFTPFLATKGNGTS